MTKDDVPHVPAWFQGGFHRFLRPFLKRHFHAIAIDRESRIEQTIDSSLPLLVYANHPSWWDPLIGHFLNLSLFPDRQFYAPIDAKALQQYRVFGKLGFYGVHLESKSGAAAFLKKSTAILNSGSTAIWLTPEGQFADVRDHSLALLPGLAHLCTKLDRGIVLPLALEYVFWDERLPVCLSKLGQPIQIADQAGLSKSQWNELITANMRDAQSGLSQLVIERSSDPFDNLLRGKRGGGMIYDSLRRLKSLATGRRFRAAHGEQFE